MSRNQNFDAGSGGEHLGLHQIPFDGIKIGQDGNLERYEGKAPVINHFGRPMVVADVGGVKVPFYNTTGHGGKKETTVGKWYPNMGVGPSGWINKTNGADMSNYYGSTELREVSEHLDKKLGDMTTPDRISKLPTASSRSTKHHDVINADLKHPAVDNDTPGAEKTVRANVEHIKSSVAGRQWKVRKNN